MSKVTGPAPQPFEAGSPLPCPPTLGTGCVSAVGKCVVMTDLGTRWQGGRYGSGGAKIAMVCPAVWQPKQFFANILPIFWSFTGVHWWKWSSRRCAFNGYSLIQEFLKMWPVDGKIDRTLVMTISTVGDCTWEGPLPSTRGSSQVRNAKPV